MEITLTPDLEEAVNAAVAAGFESPEQYISEAIKNYYRIKLDRLNAALAVGFDQLERGEVVEVENLDKYFEELEQRGDRRLEAANQDG